VSIISELYFQSLGLTYSEQVKNEYLEILTRIRSLPQSYSVIREFRTMGVDFPPHNLNSSEYAHLLESFQKQYRPQHVSGVLDAETCAIIYALSDHALRQQRMAERQLT
jgi:N-acetylmuramoyl-L-alanine amidase